MCEGEGGRGREGEGCEGDMERQVLYAGCKYTFMCVCVREVYVLMGIHV